VLATPEPAESFAWHALLHSDDIRDLGPDVRAVAVLADLGDVLGRGADEDDDREIIEGEMKGKDPGGQTGQRVRFVR
jgi:hypothetical protein